MLQNSLKNKFLYCNLWFTFRSKSKAHNIFTFKDIVPLFLCSHFVYKFCCGSYNSIYYGKNKRHFEFRRCKLFGGLAPIGKIIKDDIRFCHYTTSSDVWPNSNDFPFYLTTTAAILKLPQRNAFLSIKITFLWVRISNHYLWSFS